MHDIIIHKSKTHITPCADKCFVIVYISSGSAAVALNDMNITAVAPSCFCLNENEKLLVHESRNLSLTQIMFHPGYVNSRFDFGNLDPGIRTLGRSAELDKFYLLPFTDRDNIYRGYFSPDPEHDTTIRKKIKLLVSDYADNKSPFRPCRNRSSFLDLLLYLCRNYRGKETGDKEESLIEKVISFFTDNYQDKITIADLCTRFGTNRNTLAKKFRDETGLTVMENLAAIRVRMAASLLVKTDLPVVDILYRTGFNDTAHFGRTFKKITGIPPSEYRKSAGQKEYN